MKFSRDKKKRKIGNLKKRTWNVFSKYIRLLHSDVNGNCRCVTCGVIKPWKEMQAGHFIDGRGNSILFDERGVYPQCYSCNIKRHGNKVEYFKFMMANQGMEVIDHLRFKKGLNRVFSWSELGAMKAYYEEKIESLEKRYD